MTVEMEKPPFPMKVTRFGKLVAWTVGYDKPETQLGLTDAGAAARSLATGAEFKAAFAQVNKASALAAYVDVQSP